MSQKRHPHKLTLCPLNKEVCHKIYMGLHFQRGSQHYWCLIQVSVRGRRCPFCLQLSSDLKAPHDLHTPHGTPSPPRTSASWLHLPPLLSLTPLGIQEFLLFLKSHLLPKGLYTCCSLYYECSSTTYRYSSLPCLQGSAHRHCIRRAFSECPVQKAQLFSSSYSASLPFSTATPRCQSL